MNKKWKYVKAFELNTLKSIEEYFGVKLPNDYKSELNNCNQGKPVNYIFKTFDEKEHVLDYMIDLNDSIKESKHIANKRLIPIATDPFGNIIAYEIGNDGNTSCIVFWDHETKIIAKIADNFSSFLEKLY